MFLTMFLNYFSKLVYMRSFKAFSLFYTLLSSKSCTGNKIPLAVWIPTAHTITTYPFFIFTFNFILVLSLSTKGLNVLILVIYKFSKSVTLILGMNIQTAKKWAHTFLKRLNLIDWGLTGELITNQDPKFLSQFWMALFHKLGVSLRYSTAYHPQTDNFSERTNQTFKIAFRFFVYILENSFLWPKVLSYIQSLLNNTSSLTTSQIPSKIAYGFSPRRPLDLLVVAYKPKLVQARIEAEDIITFIISIHNNYYN